MKLPNSICRFQLCLAAVCVAVTLAATAPSAQEHADSRRKTFDELLDTNVRDGWVYYRALRAERPRLDAYISSLGGTNVESLPPTEQVAFWLNAYNAIVLQTIVEHY